MATAAGMYVTEVQQTHPQKTGRDTSQGLTPGRGQKRLGARVDDYAGVRSKRSFASRRFSGIRVG
jgi:hypothetical protein